VNIWPLLLKIGLAALGYAVAVFVAVMTAMFAFAAPSALPDGGAWGSIYRSASEFPLFFYMGITVTFPTALPGFLVTLALAWSYKWPSWFAYAVAGSINVLPSFLILSGYLNAPVSHPGLFIACLPGGFAGGFAYWALAGRLFDRWRDAKVSQSTSPAPSGF
jgi:uncharacterized membrane protein YeiB